MPNWIKREIIFSFVILFLLLILFSSLGFYDNKITAMASFNFGGIADIISNSLDLIKGGIGEPFFTAIAEDDQGIFMRIILWIIIYLLLKDGIKLNKNISEKTANILAGLISLISVAFMPTEIIRNLGPTLSTIILCIPIIFGIRYIWSIDKGQEDSFTKWKKAFFTFLLILLIMMINGWAEEFFKIGPGQIFGFVSGIGLTYCIFYLIYLIFFAGRTRSIETPSESKGKTFRNLFKKKEEIPQSQQQKIQTKESVGPQSISEPKEDKNLNVLINLIKNSINQLNITYERLDEGNIQTLINNLLYLNKILSNLGLTNIAGRDLRPRLKVLIDLFDRYKLFLNDERKGSINKENKELQLTKKDLEDRLKRAVNNIKGVLANILNNVDKLRT